jgi:hypothetical protein
MSTGWDFDSELWPPTGLLFVSQKIYEHGELWWNDVDRGNSRFVHHSSLAINQQSSGSKQEEREKGRLNLAFWSIFVHSCKWFLHAVKSYDTGPPALLSLRRKVSCGFWTPLKIYRRPGLILRTLRPVASTLSLDHRRRPFLSNSCILIRT